MACSPPSGQILRTRERWPGSPLSPAAELSLSPCPTVLPTEGRDSSKSSVGLAAIGSVAAAATMLASGTSLAATRPAPARPYGGPRPVRCSSRPTALPATRSPSTTGHAAGALRAAGSYPTGGLGGVLSGSVVDHLASQGSLAYNRASHLLYAVNAGSTTITLFSVAGDRLSRRQVHLLRGHLPGEHRRYLYAQAALRARSTSTASAPAAPSPRPAPSPCPPRPAARASRRPDREFPGRLRSRAESGGKTPLSGAATS